MQKVVNSLVHDFGKQMLRLRLCFLTTGFCLCHGEWHRGAREVEQLPVLSPGPKAESREMREVAPFQVDDLFPGRFCGFPRAASCAAGAPRASRARHLAFWEHVAQGGSSPRPRQRSSARGGTAAVPGGRRGVPCTRPALPRLRPRALLLDWAAAGIAVSGNLAERPRKLKLGTTASSILRSSLSCSSSPSAAARLRHHCCEESGHVKG